MSPGAKTFIGLILTLVTIAGCVKKEVSVSTTHDEVYTRYYRRGVNLKTETRTKSDKLLRVHFNSEAGTIDSVYVMDADGTVKFSGMHKNMFVDTLYVFDTLTGNMSFKCYYRKDVPIRTIRYWDNGQIKSDFIIDTIIEVESPMDSFAVISINQYYSGYVRMYSENGRLISEGPIKNDKPWGIWLYYDSRGIIDRRDTLGTN